MTTRTATISRLFKRNGIFHADVEFILPQIGFMTTKTVRISMQELPPSLAYLRKKKIKPPVNIVCDMSEITEKMEDQRDGIETFTVVTGFDGPVRIIGLDTCVKVSADRRSMGPMLRMHCHRRSDGRVKTPRYNIQFKVADLRGKYLPYDDRRRPGRPLDSFDRRVLDALAEQSSFILDPARGGWTRVEVDLRGLELPWVPDFIRDAPDP